MAGDGSSGVLVLLRAVAGDEEGCFLRVRRAREGESFQNLAGAGQQDAGHPCMRPDGPAVEESLRSAPLHPGIISLAFKTQSQGAGNHLLAEEPLADEDRDYEQPGSGEARQDAGKLRRLFPESLAHLGKELPTAKRSRVLDNRGARFEALRRAMAHQHQRGIGIMILTHAPCLTQAPELRKRAGVEPSNLNLRCVSGDYTASIGRGGEGRGGEGKSEGRKPKSEGRPKIEIRTKTSVGRLLSRRGGEDSVFGFRTSFGFRILRPRTTQSPAPQNHLSNGKQCAFICSFNEPCTPQQP